MRKFKKTLGIATILMLILTVLPISVFAAEAGEKVGSYTASLSKTTVTVGGSTSLTITAKKAAGQFAVTSSNPSVAKVSTGSIWVDGSHVNASGKISIKAVSEGTATITITPVNVSDRNLNLLTNKKTIKITVKKAATTTTKPTTTTPTKSSDATLKSLTSNIVDIDFSKDKTSYTVNVDKTVTSLGLAAEVNNANAKVEITGDEKFVTGNNVVSVKVTAEDGTTKTYKITVVKSKYGSGPLKELKVKGYALSPDFDPSVNTYSVKVIDETKVDVEYVLTDATSKVTVEGADNLKVGSNKIKVVVTEKDGKVTKYTINVNAISTVVPVDDEGGNGIWIIIVIILILLIAAEAAYIAINKKKEIEEAKKAEAQKAAAKKEAKKGAAKKTATKGTKQTK